MPADLSSTVAGVHLPFAAMNAAGTVQTAEEVRQLLESRAGAIVLWPTTVHPFVHPSFRSLHNPGIEKLLPLVRQLVTTGEKPIVASIAGATIDEYEHLARAFSTAGAALVEVNLADPWLAATLGPLEDAGVLRELLTRTVLACGVPVAAKIADLGRIPHGRLGDELAMAGVRVVVARNEFTGFEKFRLEAGEGFELVVAGDIRSGYDVSRALAKGARAVQVGADVMREGTRVFARLEREMRIARREWPS